MRALLLRLGGLCSLPNVDPRLGGVACLSPDPLALEDRPLLCPSRVRIPLTFAIASCAGPSTCISLLQVCFPFGRSVHAFSASALCSLASSTNSRCAHGCCSLHSADLEASSRSCGHSFVSTQSSCGAASLELYRYLGNDAVSTFGKKVAKD